MSTLLLIVIYVIYIGLGVPDSSFGTALPAMWNELGLPLSLASVVTVIISLGTVLSSFFSAKIINFFKPGLTIALSTLITAFAVLGFAFSNKFLFLCFCAFPLGIGAGAIDAAVNGYVATRYSPSQMSFLHCFYGIGVIVSPFIFSITLLKDNNWRLGFIAVFIILLVLSLIAFLSLPLWNKIKSSKEEIIEKPTTLKYSKMAKNPAIVWVWIAFFFTCALEFTCNTWATSYLVNNGLSEAKSARYVIFYYGGIAVGRFLSGLALKFISGKKIIAIGYSFILVALIILFLPLPVEFKGLALCLIGIGNSPTFPNLTFLFPNRYKKEYSQSLISSQMFSSNLGILLMPPLFGVIADIFSVAFFPIYISVLFLILVISTILHLKLPNGIL